MGKRELLLIVAFVIVGAVVYQATAPPAGPNDRSLSFSRILDHIRRELRGKQAQAETTRVLTHEADATLTELRVAGTYTELAVTGEDRRNIEIRFRVMSNGYDDAEAKRLVEATQLEVDHAAATLRLAVSYPKPGQQRTFATILVPARLGVRIDSGSAQMVISNVASVELLAARGETRLARIAGRTTVTHRAGRIAIDDVAALKLTGHGSDATVTKVRGDASFSLQSGELIGTGLSGPIDIEAESAEVTLSKLEETQGPLRVNAVGGSVTLNGVHGDARVDGRNTEIQITMARPASLAVYNEGDEAIEITTPGGGFMLDALATDGRITVPEDIRSELTSSTTTDDKDQRMNGAVRGGGPTITLRANHGDIIVRTLETSKPER